MHELSIAESIINIILDEIPKHNITKVYRITLRIGEMRLVIPEALRFSFELMTKNTPLEGAEIIIENISTVGRCTNCGYEFNIVDWFDNCPKCKETNIEVISGKEMEIVNFEGN